MPSTAQLNSANRMETNNTASLHNKLANFVLDLQTDVRLEDLLDENRVNTAAVQRQNMPCTQRDEVHIKHLRHLYDEIRNQQTGIINTHEQTGKRRQADNTSGRSKMLRNSDLLHDTDCLDETWLLNFAAQLGLDKKIELPVLNCDFMRDFV